LLVGSGHHQPHPGAAARLRSDRAHHVQIWPDWPRAPRRSCPSST